MARFILSLFALCLATVAHAQSSCSSDGVPPPRAVLERFISADCDACWRDTKSPAAGAQEIAIDWVVPGAKGDDAPLAAVATRDAIERLRSLGRKAPADSTSVHTQRTGSVAPRVAHGLAFNDYMGTSVESPRGGTVWLLLVERLPAGTEGSPVERNLVRNVLHIDRAKAPVAESRPMQIPEGASPDRLRLVALLADARGRLVGTALSACP